MPLSFHDYQSISPPTYFHGAFRSRFVGEDELRRLEQLMRDLQASPETRTPLIDLFTLRCDPQTLGRLAELGEHLERDIRIAGGREFFYHRGRLRDAEPLLAAEPREHQRLLLQEIDHQAHIACVGEVLLLIASGLLHTTLTPIYTPFPALTGASRFPRIWARVTSSSRPNKMRHLSLEFVDHPQLDKGEFVLFVRAHRVPQRIEAKRVYQLHDSATAEKTGK